MPPIVPRLRAARNALAARAFTWYTGRMKPLHAVVSMVAIPLRVFGNEPMTAIALSTLAFVAAAQFATCDEPPANVGTNIDAVAVAKAAVPDLFYDKARPIVVSSSNGVSVVSFPRMYNPWSSVTNGPTEVARIWVDETTGDILPEAGTVPLSDAEVIAICHSPAPDIANYLRGDPEIRRISSLTIATYFCPLATDTNVLVKAYEFMIETRSRYLLGVRAFPQ